MKANHAKVLSLILSLVLFILIVIIGWQNKAAIFRVIRRADLRWLAVGFGCYFFNYLTRARRLWLLTRKRLDYFPVAVKITCLHGFYSYFLPLRSGDLSLPFLLHLTKKFPLTQGGGVLFRIRMLDFFSLGLLLAWASLVTTAELSVFLRGLFFASGMGLVILSYGLIYLVNRGNDRIKKIFSRRLGKIGQIKITYPGMGEILISLLVWFWTGCTIFAIIKSLFIPLTFMDVWFFAAIQLPLQLLPLQGVANTGNHEAGWMAALSLLGIKPAISLSLTMASHVILITYVGLLGLFALALPAIDGRNRIFNRTRS